MQVLKFGGSSVANAENISKVIAIARGRLKKDKTIMVSSAIGGATDALIEIGKCAKTKDITYIEKIKALEKKHLDIIAALIPKEDSSAIKNECKALFARLEEIAKSICCLGELSSLSLDSVMSFGELLSTKIISAKFKSLNISNVWKDSRELIKTERIGAESKIIRKETLKNISDYFSGARGNLFVLPGFIASDEQGCTTTLGRGGSDYTASVIAEGISARVLEIWTDVNGMMTADPRIAPDARPIRNISYKEALELSHFGAKVVYPPTIQPVVKQGIPIYVKNTFCPDDAGTLIEKNPPEGGEKIRGISSSDKIALLSMEGAGMVGVPGYSARLFNALAKSNINIILITQASSVYTMCVAISEADAAKAKRAADDDFAYEISLGKVEPLKIEKGFSIISLVGDDLENQSGASARMFDALGREGVNIRAIAQGSSEKNISAVLQTPDIKAAIRAIHKEFFSTGGKRINLFIAGCGTVGSALVKMIYEQRDSISKRLGKELVVCGICNSRNFAIARDGIASPFEKKTAKKEAGNAKGAGKEKTVETGEYSVRDIIKNFLSAGEKNSGDEYIEKIFDLNLSNSVFVDCTADKGVALKYTELFRHSIDVTACNKIACSLPEESYKELFETARNNGVSFAYETSAGAALPFLSTVKQIVNSGDRIRKIEGILSGTLNYLLSNYDGKSSFAELVEKARVLGYTEPDPRTDLSGTDVLRKFVIIAREAGFSLEMNSIGYKPFFEGEYEGKLKKLFKEAQAEGKKLRFCAVMNCTEAGKAAGKSTSHDVVSRKEQSAYEKITIDEHFAGIKAFGPQHPFYNVEGSDNALYITTEFYPQGVLIRGAGAGAKQTASGLLNDILYNSCK